MSEVEDAGLRRNCLLERLLGELPKRENAGGTEGETPGTAPTREERGTAGERIGRARSRSWNDFLERAGTGIAGRAAEGEAGRTGDGEEGGAEWGAGDGENPRAQTCARTGPGGQFRRRPVPEQAPGASSGADLCQNRPPVPFAIMSGVYGFVYAPTIALTNSLAFHHMPDRDRDFGVVRLWGTVGWIVAGILVGQYLLRACTPVDGTLEEIKAAQDAGRIFAFNLSAGLGVLMGIFCFTLPNTPPSRNEGSKLAWAACGPAVVKWAGFLSFEQYP